MDIIATYIILQTALFCILVVTGYYLSKGKSLKSRNYWIIASISIIVYSLIEGLRYDRGVDYMMYKSLFEYSLNLSAYLEKPEKIESLFQIFNKFFHFVNFSYPFVFVFYSLVLIIAGFYFIKEHRKVAFYAIPMFFMATIVQSETLVRQLMAFSFVLISLKFFLNNSWIKFVVLITMAINIHSSSIVFLPFIFLFKYIKNPFGNLYVILGLYFISWLWKPEYWGNYYKYFQNLSLGYGLYQGYLENADTWFSGEKVINSIHYFGMLSYIKTFLFNTGMIVLGYRILDKYRFNNYPFYFFLFVVGAIAQHFTFQIELLYRISLYFYMFWFIVLAYIVSDSLSHKIKNLEIKRCICYFMIICALWDFFAPLFVVDTADALFIWS